MKCLNISLDSLKSRIVWPTDESASEQVAFVTKDAEPILVLALQFHRDWSPHIKDGMADLVRHRARTAHSQDILMKITEPVMMWCLEWLDENVYQPMHQVSAHRPIITYISECHDLESSLTGNAELERVAHQLRQGTEEGGMRAWLEQERQLEERCRQERMAQEERSKNEWLGREQRYTAWKRENAE